MPDTLVGLLLLLAAASPGAEYVRVRERYLPRSERSDVREIAEFAFVGSATTLGALAAWLGLLALIDTQYEVFTDGGLTAFAADPITEMVTDWRTALFMVLSVVVVLGGSAGLAHALARSTVRGRSARLHPDRPLWYEAVVVWMDTHHVFATLELEGGEVYSGYVRSAPMHDDKEGALVLWGDIFRRPRRGGPEARVMQQFLVVPTSNVRLAGLQLDTKAEP